MLVTPSLASGAVKEAARSNSAAVSAMLNELKRRRIKAPATYRRFNEWFRTNRHLHEHCALLIVFGAIARRGGAFSAFMPLFQEGGGGWELEIRQLSVRFSPGQLEFVSLERMPVTISGHALERMFQRNGTIQWSMVRDCLAAATLLLNAAVPAYVAAGCRQCAIPAEKGLLVGQVVAGELALRTFLPALDLRPRWQSLLSDLTNFPVKHKQAVEVSALTSDNEAANALQTLLRSGKHDWLFDPYVPGVDARDEAWRSKESAGEPA